MHTTERPDAQRARVDPLVKLDVVVEPVQFDFGLVVRDLDDARLDPFVLVRMDVEGVDALADAEPRAGHVGVDVAPEKGVRTARRQAVAGALNVLVISFSPVNEVDVDADGDVFSVVGGVGGSGGGCGGEVASTAAAVPRILLLGRDARVCGLDTDDFGLAPHADVVHDVDQLARGEARAVKGKGVARVVGSVVLAAAAAARLGQLPFAEGVLNVGLGGLATRRSGGVGRGSGGGGG